MPQNNHFANKTITIASRLTSTERDAIAHPVPGTIIYNTTTGAFQIYVASVGWKTVTVS